MEGHRDLFPTANASSININIVRCLKIIVTIISAPKRNGEMEFEDWPCRLLAILSCDWKKVSEVSFLLFFLQT